MNPLLMLKSKLPIFGCRLTGLALRIQVAVCIFSISCNDVAPTPSHPGNIGDEDRALLPPPGARHDATVLKGTADWKPFRKADDAVKNKTAGGGDVEGEGAAGAVEAGGGAIEKEIETLLTDYNALVAEGKFADTFEFFIAGQAPIVKLLSEQLPAISTRIKDLGEAIPEQKDALNKLAKNLLPDSSLKLSVSDIKEKGAKEATGTLTSVPPFSIFPGAPSSADLPKNIRFVVGEDEVWFIDWPIIPALEGKIEQMTARVAEWDAIIADAKTGKLSADDLEKRAPEIWASMKIGDGAEAGEKKPSEKEGS